jgi:hypothetical protein
MPLWEWVVKGDTAVIWNTRLQAERKPRPHRDPTQVSTPGEAAARAQHPVPDTRLRKP